MPYAISQGFRIHYEIIGEGPPLVLQHGFTMQLQDWYEHGYVRGLQDHYRLILVDALGHGMSDKPHDAACYSLERQVRHITDVFDSLDICGAAFWGFSMGATIGFAIAKFAAHRVNALVVGGAHPYASNRAILRDWLQAGLRDGSEALIPTYEKMMGPVPIDWVKRLRKADLKAWLALVATDREGLEDVLPKMTMPCLIYAGEFERSFADAKIAAEHIPNCRFFPLPDLTHVQAFVESGRVLPVVKDFLDRSSVR